MTTYVLDATTELTITVVQPCVVTIETEPSTKVFDRAEAQTIEGLRAKIQLLNQTIQSQHYRLLEYEGDAA